MKRAEFEEKEFETPLYTQLQVASNRVWSPGQVLEHYIGFDYAAFCEGTYLWVMHGHHAPLSGVLLSEIGSRLLARYPGQVRPLPDFSLNLFLQAKRPEVRSRLTQALRELDIQSPFWRISIEGSQQTVLEALASETEGKALVCYAAPAFDRITQLYSHITESSLIQNSSFPEASWLCGHQSWNYDRPGAEGVANEDPKLIREAEILARIEALSSEGRTDNSDDYDANLASLAKSINSALENAENGDQGRRSVFTQRVQVIDNYMRPYGVGRYTNAIRNYLAILAFVDTYNLRWLVLAR